MRVIIFSNTFYPNISARANRGFELAKQISKMGHKVDIIIDDNGFDYKHIEEKYAFNVIKILDKQDNVIYKKNVNIKENKLIKIIKSIIRYILGGEWENINLYKRYKELKNLKLKEYDLGISIGLPFSNHIVYQLLNKKRKIAKINIADYGDPYTNNKTIKKLFIYKNIEKIVSNKFDFLTIPIEQAINSFDFIKDSRKLKVIPQGFEINILDYKVSNKICTFGFSGNFYKGIRNPKNLFDELAKINRKFLFVIYVNKQDKNQMEMVNYGVNRLGEKLKVNDFIKRENCIQELSKMDFLLNLENLTSNQLPSKLIDYSIAGRPILSLNPKNIDKNKIINFIDGNYKEAYSINLDNYDIKKVAQKFIELASEDISCIYQ